MSSKFNFEWRTALLAAILLPVMIGLGFWQLQRADENSELLRVAEQYRQRQPLALVPLVENQITQDIESGNFGAWHLQQVSIQGQWLEKYFLLENQMHEGRNGYYVIGAMKLASGRNLLVNRGWVIAPALRSELPVIPPAVTAVIEVGEAYVSQQILQETAIYAETGWPRRVGRLGVPEFAHELGLEVLPVIVRLHEGSPSALTAKWPVVNIAPEKNTAYAIQWFAMSVALVLFYLYVSFRPDTPNYVNDEAPDG
jgi:surfeit locus 1 family protein